MTSLATFKTVARLLTTAGFGIAIFLGLVATGAADPQQERVGLSWIDERIAEWELSEEERRFDEIGWADGLSETSTSTMPPLSLRNAKAE
jgi:hypothetical protein